jgi:AcrR family transcriptional regulator
LATHHFQSREGLLREALGELLKPRRAVGELGLNELLSSLERSVARLSAPHTRALLGVLAGLGLPTFIKDAAAAYWVSVTKLVEAHLRAGQEAGVVRAELEPAGVAQQILASLFGLAVAAPWRLGTDDGARFLADTRRSLVRPEIDEVRLTSREAPRRPQREQPSEQSLFPEFG